MSPPADIPDDIPFPAHAYVPGKTPRHPDGWFDDLRNAAKPGTPLSELHLTRAFIAGRVYFDAGFFWECHEVLEAVWMQAPDPSPERDFVQAMIQLANARLKLRMDRPRATLRLCEMVEARTAGYSADDVILGLPVGYLRSGAAETRDDALKHYNSQFG